MPWERGLIRVTIEGVTFVGKRVTFGVASAIGLWQKGEVAPGDPQDR
jgi:hypothetical protein